MPAGPIFNRELSITPRRAQHYVYRAVYVATLLVLTCTAWLMVVEAQAVRNIGDMSRFGAVLFQLLAPIQLILMVFISALGAASSVAQEKDKRTLILLLMTRMSNVEIVIGKLLASMLNALTMLACAIPVFVAVTACGGTSLVQLIDVFAVTAVTAIAAGSLGVVVALWREKTFQTLAITTLMLVGWMFLGPVLAEQVWLTSSLGLAPLRLGVATSPFQAILQASQPSTCTTAFTAPGIGLFMILTGGLVLLVNTIGIARVRIWNPSRGVRSIQRDEDATIFSSKDSNDAEEAREGHVDARLREDRDQTKTRRVWDNPVLWRETQTWAYGKRILAIKFTYVLLACAAFASLHYAGQAGGLTRRATVYQQDIVPPAAKPIAPLVLISLVMINALAVTAITNERDGQMLDLLLVTDLTPKEFIFGKLGGILWLTREMVVLPILLCGYLAWLGGLSAENLVFVVGGLVVLNVFVAMLGIHCGLNYANSRTAIGVSLGVVFFLFLGVGICIVLMVSFSGTQAGGAGAFFRQLAPFLAFILGGSIGLIASLGARNPSRAIILSSLGLPLATFFAVTSFLLRNQELSVFVVTSLAYGFTTAAMLVPALAEFDIAMGRTKTAEED